MSNPTRSRRIWQVVFSKVKSAGTEIIGNKWLCGEMIRSKQVTKVATVQQSGPIPFGARDKPGQSLIGGRSLPRKHGNFCHASFHHVHMICVRYFDSLICGWTSAWVLPLLGQASHLWLTPLASIRNYKRRIKTKSNHSIKLVDPNQPLTKQHIN